MKITNGEIYNALVAKPPELSPLEKLLAEKLPVKVSYPLARLTSRMKEQLQIIEKVRQGLLKTYGEPSKENPQQIIINNTSENYSKFVTEIGELLALDIEIVFEKVMLPDTLEIEPTVLMALDKFIKV